MALARTALRIAAVAALAADPTVAALCATRIFDSRIDELDAREAVPVIVVYTEDDNGTAWSVNNGGPPFDHRCALQLEISMRVTVAGEDGSGNAVVDIGMPETDREMEAALDLIEEAAVRAVTIADTPQALLIRQAVTRRTSEIRSIRFASAESGAKLAMRIVTLTTELKGDRTDPLDPPTGPFAALPDPLRTVAQALDPSSAPYSTCMAIAARMTAAADGVLRGIDVTIQPSIDFDPTHPPSPTGPPPSGVVVADRIATTIDLPS